MKKDHKNQQVFTPAWATNEMLDMIDRKLLSDHETFFFEPSCGNGEMLVVILDRILNELVKKYGDIEQALVDTLFKFYAIEIDEALVVVARRVVYDWAVSKIDRDLSALEMYLIARSLQQSIEHRDFFDVIDMPIDAPNGRKAINRIKRKGRK